MPMMLIIIEAILLLILLLRYKYWFRAFFIYYSFLLIGALWFQSLLSERASLHLGISHWIWLNAGAGVTGLSWLGPKIWGWDVSSEEDSSCVESNSFPPNLRIILSVILTLVLGISISGNSTKHEHLHGVEGLANFAPSGANLTLNDVFEFASSTHRVELSSQTRFPIKAELMNSSGEHIKSILVFVPQALQAGSGEMKLGCVSIPGNASAQGQTIVWIGVYQNEVLRGSSRCLLNLDCDTITVVKITKSGQPAEIVLASSKKKSHAKELVTLKIDYNINMN